MEPKDHFGDSTKLWGLAFYNLKYYCVGYNGDCSRTQKIGCFLTHVTPFVSEQWKNYAWLTRNETFPHLFPSNHFSNSQQ